MIHRVLLAAILIVVLFAAASAVAGPILKPRKYHGPIPRSTLTLSVGFLGGASNEEMFDYFSRQVPQFARDTTQSNDFGNAPLVQLTYTYKAHPQVAVRGNLYAALLESDWTGVLVPNIPPPSGTTDEWLPPVLLSERTFDVYLFTLEASALYYFTDASVKEFQPYIGGGFSFGFPYQKYKDTQTVLVPDADPGDPGYQPATGVGDTFSEFEKDEISFEAGVQGILGALYYFNNKWAVSVEGRLQILQSKFPLTVPDEQGNPEEVKFDLDYSGFILAAGVSYAF
jgi:hypothetical protein